MGEVVRRYRVVGRVQGVGFRWFVREAARALDLRGWVRNEASGEVLVEVGGPLTDVEQLAGRLAEGPPGAHVTAVLGEAPIAVDARALPAPFAVHR